MTRLVHRARVFAALSAAERAQVFEAGGLIALLGLRLRASGFRAAQAWGRARAGRRTTTPADSRLISRQVVHAVERAARALPGNPNCLLRSLTVWTMLAARGVAGELRFGARRVSGRTEAHAWVEVDGRVINDAPDVGERFPVLEPITA